MAGASPEMVNPRFRPPKNERDSRGDGEAYCGLAGALFATLEVSERVGHAGWRERDSVRSKLGVVTRLDGFLGA